MPKSHPPAPEQRTAVLRVERMALASLRPHPRNPRRHPPPGTPQWAALARSLEHDYFDPLVVNMRPGPNERTLVSGHLRLKVLLAAGYTHADVSVVDYDEATHLARLLAANRQQGADEDAQIQDLLVELDTGAFDMLLTGFAEDDLRDLLAPADPPGAAPNEEGKLTPHWSIVIDCATEGEQTALLERFLGEGLPCRALIL